MNRNLQLRADLRDEDKYVDHDFRLISAAVDLTKGADTFYLELADAYGVINGFYQKCDARKPTDLLGNVFNVSGFAIDPDDPEIGIDVMLLDPPLDPGPSLVTVPQLICAQRAIPALHEMIEMLDAMESRSIARYIHRVLGSDPVFPYFFKAKAALSAHHSYEGGLAVHSVECARCVAALPAAMFNCSHARDLAIGSAMLHDLGKVAWATGDYVNHKVLHESRSILLAADGLRQLRKETDAPTAEMALYLLARESHSDIGRCPEAVAVTMADRLSATKDGHSKAFSEASARVMTRTVECGGPPLTYLRIIDPDEYATTIGQPFG